MLRELTPEVRSFLETATWPGVLSTLGPGGAPITSAVWFGFLEGDVIISTPAGRPKARNARNDSRVSFIVDTKDRPYRGVAIEGEAEVLEDHGKALMRSIAMRHLGPELPPEMEERIALRDRVVLRIRPRKVRPWNLA
ncbi:MAG: TIGR03618 family F420-dependent PPOX class oxidoreductase [Chloroflexi bacterium]|nr:TIGR03618 family F420-dependent PPOX class oxidoreductase [Chloroflexota bacterium]MCZ7578519.1 TIGR03618 family F420-dependent PPOX class oxidoreductase [Dehalococcoidia bacterium]